MSVQLTELCKPFPKAYLGKDDRGNDAVDHTVVTQRLLDVLGPYSMHIVEVLRTEVPGMKTKSGKEYPGGFFVTGAIVALHLVIDGREIVVHETGGCENAAMKDGDGERLKHAVSDAIKRCAMRFGLGLHMWAQSHYYLYDKLTRPELDVETGEVPASSASPTPAPEAVEAEEPDAGAGASSPASTPPPKKKKVTPKRGALNKAFHAKLGQMGIDYEGEARHALRKAYDGRTLSELSDDDLSKLLDRLDDSAGEERFRILCRTATEEATAA